MYICFEVVLVILHVYTLLWRGKFYILLLLTYVKAFTFCQHAKSAFLYLNIQTVFLISM